jgi:DNA/RNA endonuclease G (NUC1)
MKKYLFLFPLLAIAAWTLPQQAVTAQAEMPSPHLVISQFQPGTTANANDEFVEIHNNGSAPVDLNGYRLVYRSQNGSNDVGPFAVWTTSTILQPGQYYLIASTSYSGSVTPNLTYNPTTCTCSMSASNGGLAIRQGDMNTGVIIDAVGWGTGSNIFFENTRTIAPPSGSSQARQQAGCQDTDNNANDFSTLTPFGPRNLSTAPVTCAGSGASLFAAMSANPTSVAPPGNTLLTVTVIPATTPPSTNITVVANLINIGGSTSQTFFDDGTNGDVTPGDNVFSYLATVPAGTPGGAASLTGVATDAQGRTANFGTTITVNAAPPGEDPLILGNPSGATANIANENNYLMTKPTHTFSYNRSRNIPNWTAWRLDSSWIGSANNGSFAPDTSLPAGWYQVLPEDYAEPVYDRGHMTPSGDRTNTQTNNDYTYLMTNIIPQLPANNQGPWADLENYCRTLASQGNEVYIVSGGIGTHTTIGSSSLPERRIAVPTHTWKVVLVLPNGNNDLARASAKNTRAFGVIMSNVSISQSAPWRNFRVTVDAVEYFTGYDFFNLIPKNTQEIIERRRDRL